MGKLKYYICIILWTFIPQAAIATDLELSDTIREARELQINPENKTEIGQQTTQNNMLQNEKNACEKLNPTEILKEQTSKN